MLDVSFPGPCLNMQWAVGLASELPQCRSHMRRSPVQKKGLLKFGSARTGAEIMACLSVLKAFVASSLHLNESFLSSSVSGLLITPYPLINFL